MKRVWCAGWCDDDVVVGWCDGGRCCRDGDAGVFLHGVFLHILLFCVRRSHAASRIVWWASISFVHPPIGVLTATEVFESPLVFLWRCFCIRWKGVRWKRWIHGRRIDGSRWWLLLHRSFNVSRWRQRRWFRIRMRCGRIGNRLLLRRHTWRRFKIHHRLLLLLLCCAFRTGASVVLLIQKLLDNLFSLV